jgi:Tfp pilus assembly protein PilF
LSLLLDALKRAEQEKLAKHGDRHAGEHERGAHSRAAPLPSPPSSRASAPSLELQPLTAPPSGGAAAAPAPKSDAASAQNVFQAKAGAGVSKKHIALWSVVGVVVAVMAGAGIYVWYSIQSFTPRLAASARPRPAAAPTAAPASSGFVEAPPKFDLQVAALAPVKTESAREAPRETPRKAPLPAQPPAEDLIAALLAEPAAAPARPALRLAPSQEKARVPTEIAAGYDSLRSGDLLAARRSYVAALLSDASNLDALLGLATVEARLGNRPAAASHYRRALDVDPRNPTALAGLASLADYARPEGLEAQLRADVARYPQSSALHFTLGNLYASQSRWQDAQLEFFEAHRLEPASADIAFNLAVSMDHLGQSRLAADYYRRALEGARNQATQFDPAPVARRLAELGR